MERFNGLNVTRPLVLAFVIGATLTSCATGNRDKLTESQAESESEEAVGSSPDGNPGLAEGLSGEELSEEAKDALAEDILNAVEKLAQSPADETAVDSDSPRDIRNVIQDSAHEKRQSQGHGLKKLQVPLEINQEVLKWVRFFAVKDRDRFQRFLNRGEVYREVVEATLRENSVPSELYYLGMIESGYSNHAVSHASAVGPWQFIRGTARRYGLAVGFYNDERRDPIRSSEAAAKYLRDLYAEFGSWYLAMAAYNSGENRVRRAIRRAGTNDYWELTRRRFLPAETRNYVPKFLAALVIGRHPEWFGFDTVKTASYPSVKAVEVPRSVHFRSIAALTSINTEQLAEVNPHLRKQVTPPGTGNYEIWVPAEKAQELTAAAEDLLQHRDLSIRQQSYLELNDATFHKVRSGQTLGSIARQYRVTVPYLIRVNGLRNGDIYSGQRLRVRSSGYARRSYEPLQPRSDVAHHRVQSGQTLESIAGRYGVTVSQLMRFNGLSNSRIRVGQTLRVRPHMMLTVQQRQLAAQGRAQVQLNDGKKIYMVRRGDNLHTIARQFGLSVHQLKRLNNLRRNTIYAGQELRIAAR